APYASINFVTAHDGFTLRDLVSYNDKHNEANGEDNKDGESHNRSWNSGAEGETSDQEVLALRARRQRNVLATLLLSQGTPMLLYGDELGRTQRGNNNAYCQDNELSWVDWSSVDKDLVAFVNRLTTLRAEHPVLRRRRFFTGDRDAEGVPDVAWLRPDGEQMDADDWDSQSVRSMAVYLNGRAITEPDRRGEKISDDSFLMLLNSGADATDFTLPDGLFGDTWEVVLDTAVGDGGGSASIPAASTRTLIAHSLVLLRRV
ncbi:MAG: glycogen debranching enzyme, partial [Nocardioidaceae bacterium]